MQLQIAMGVVENSGLPEESITAGVATFNVCILA